MRYLFVYQDFVASVEELLAELSVTDIQVISVKKGESSPSTAVLSCLPEAGGVCAVIQVDRKYRKSLGAVEVEQVFKQFRRNDQVLRQWLVPIPAREQARCPPTEAFEAAVADCGWLMLADDALVRADEVSPIRWDFVGRAAQLLRRLALGEQLGPMRQWQANHGIHFAPNGQVHFSYSLPKGPPIQPVYWHLTEGRSTTAEGASRIYFDLRSVEGVAHVLVFYVGPHPEDGGYQASFESAKWCGAPPGAH
ncbi:hypothetical protein [Stenotrophomonas maltophilia]|uniref:Uncharacterized protein n=1 Tax=Stenotrophomonas maltophilia TaxID=40324 RepID=A0A246IDA2_STEMA|nr:hypothetical protein [Stenotrophomonas maltophilia]OWQ78004.1 hypothetical protein CEE63_03060 [Stenotrophomonas maltophilia]